MSVNLWANNELTFLAGGGRLSGWVGTTEEYEAQKDSITDGTVVYITDDSSPESTPVILDTATEVLNNTTDQVIAGAKAVKELQTYSIDEVRIGTWVDGRTIYRKVFTYSASHTSGTTDEITVGTIISGSTVVNIGGVWIPSSSGSSIPICYSNISTSNASGNTNCTVSSNGNVIVRIGSGVGTNTVSITAIIEYAKPTD